MKRGLLLVGAFGLVAILVVVLSGCSGWATAGGWIPSKGCDGKATFGFHAAYDGCDWTGNLSYTDHNYTVCGDKMINLQGTVTGGDSISGRFVTGVYQPKPKGECGKFYLYLKDDGQPQEGDDTFTIILKGGSFSGYRNSGELGGGNVVIDYGHED